GLGDVAEIAYDAAPVAGQRDAMDLPFIELGYLPVQAFFDAFGNNMGFACFESVAEPLHDFVRVGFGPKNVKYLVEVAPDRPGDVAERRTCDGIHRSQSE